ncbi:MAG TPA: ThuA domain-containing protein [Armatimonadota bacterium]|nr:ThuA domain-containing protein [Armatimonadota bacterium]HQK93463.1 ThuA domain-containing protein [Armatimonadota bacterium]
MRYAPGLLVGAVAVAALAARVPAVGRTATVRALIVTGGHDFERDAFFAMFSAEEGLEWREALQPAASDEYTESRAKGYDAIVLYDMMQEITDAQKANLLARIREGKGLVVLHHALGSYDTWPEWWKVVGGHYLMTPRTVDGRDLPGSTFREGVDIRVQIADRHHPVTRGLEDFTIHDEVYGGMWVSPDAHLLLRTDHPESTPEMAWAGRLGRGRVAAIQLGHGPSAYANPSYRRLVGNAIRWCARKD